MEEAPRAWNRRMRLHDKPLVAVEELHEDGEVSDGVAHEAEAGVGDAGVAGVGAERDVLPRAEALEDLRAGALLGALAVGDHPRGARDAEVREQLPGVARVLRGDDGDGAQRLERARRKVAEVSDRCRDEMEHFAGPAFGRRAYGAAKERPKETSRSA